MTPKVSIIILNWNRWRDTIECVESVLRISYPNYEIVIVDNILKPQNSGHTKGVEVILSAFPRRNLKAGGKQR